PEGFLRHAGRDRGGVRTPADECHQASDAPAPLLMFAATVHSEAKPIRSEEHTSELQSLTNLVCRLLLEKKKKKKQNTKQQTNTKINNKEINKNNTSNTQSVYEDTD